MASPDARPFVDLTLYDRSPTELVDRALLDAGAKLPGWQPLEGNTEVVLIESLALVVAELVYAVNRVPGTVLEVLLRLFGLTRSAGVAPTATVTVTVVDAAGYTIPAGTAFRLDATDPATVLTLDADLEVLAGATTATGAVTGTVASSAANSVPAGTTLGLLSNVASLEAAELATAPTGGAGPEDAAEFLTRAVNRLARLSDALVLPEHFTAYALEDPAVARATTVDLYDPPAGTPGSDVGHVTVAVATAGGGSLGAGAMADLETAMEARAVAGLNVHVIDPTVTPVDVTATVVRLAGYDAAEVDAAATAALTAYLDPDSWPWGGTVRRNELIAVLDRVEGVDYVDTLTVPAADVVLPGVAPLADAGALAVTVTGP